MVSAFVGGSRCFGAWLVAMAVGFKKLVVLFLCLFCPLFLFSSLTISLCRDDGDYNPAVVSSFE